MTEQEKFDWVYNCLEDEESRFIFKNRWNFNLSGNYHYLEEIIDNYVTEFSDYKWNPNERKELIQFIKDCGKKVVIFGAGYSGKELLRICNNEGISVEYFCDNDLNKQNTEVENVPVISPKEISEQGMAENHVFIIAVRLGHKDVYNMLIGLGIPSDAIRRFINHCFSDAQYFDELIHFGKDEVLIDGGSFDFNTSKLFLEKVRGQGADCKKIYAFEPDEANYKKCQENVEKSGLENVSLVCAGLWNEDIYVKFQALGDAGSRIVPADREDADKVRVIALDNMVKEKVTFIKLDVEGAELAALQGAENILLRDKPKLAICIYHKKEDLWEIPHYIKTLVPEYKLYVRHYSNYWDETVLYATV